MEEQETILPPEVSDNVARNLQEMSETRRTQMVAQIVPFLAAFLAELLRAVNLGCPVTVDDQEEEEESGMMQIGLNTRGSHDVEETSLMQGTMPAGRFGGLLHQLQAQLEGQDLAKQQQAATHMAKLLVHLRQLAGELTPQLADRFARLEALLACFQGEDVNAPLAVQLWAEGQLRRLTPLMGGAAPSVMSEPAAADEVMTIEDSLPSGEVLVKRGPSASWEHATKEERDELARHEAQVKEEEEKQQKHDEYLLACQDAAKAQDFEDWAVASEMDRRCPPPSRKRVRVAVCVGASSGSQIGHAIIEGNLPVDQQATVTFQVQETILGGDVTEEGRGLEHSTGPVQMEVATPAAEDMETVDVEELPELDEDVKKAMQSTEVRVWLRKLRRMEVTFQEVQVQFGEKVAEAMAMWLSLQEDHDKDVLNCGEHGVGYVRPTLEANGSDSSSSSGSQASVETRPYMPGEARSLPCEDNGDATAHQARSNKAEEEGEGDAVGKSVCCDSQGSGTSGQGFLADHDRDLGCSEGAGLNQGQGHGGSARGGSPGRDGHDSAGGLSTSSGSNMEVATVADEAGAVPPPAAVGDTMDTQLSDGEQTQPGNDHEQVSAATSSELPEGSASAGPKQTDLRSWLK